METASNGNSAQYLGGKLLVAMPNLREGCFAQSVVLICSHDDTHAMGVILNKEIVDVSFGELLLQLEIKPRMEASGRRVYLGGPVDTKRGLVLHTPEYRTPDTVEICTGVCLTATKRVLEDLNGGPAGDDGEKPVPPEKALLCMGHAGWAPGQLESELTQNAWLHMPADPELIFASDTSDAWERALASLGVTQSMFSAEWSDLRDPDTPLN